jgi:hypothetical protein
LRYRRSKRGNAGRVKDRDVKSIFLFILCMAIVQAVGCIEYKDLTPLLVEEGQGSIGEKAFSHTTVKPNETVCVKCPVHGSVGIDCEYDVSDSKVLSHIDSKVEYVFRGG